MSPPRKSTSRKRRTTPQKGWFLTNFRQILVFILLFSLLVISVCMVGYVIFFRTVFAGEVSPGYRPPVVYEEPDPPVHEDLREFVKIEPSANDQVDQNIDLPKVVIIIDDIGYHRILDKQFLQFPFTLTYSFLPYAPFTPELVKEAGILGKTIFLHLPLEPKDKRWNSGPGTLYLQDNGEQQLEKFEESLTRVPGVIGVNNHMGSLFTENETAMRRLLEKINSHSLFFIDSYTTAASTGLRVAKELGIPTARRHVFLDNVLNQKDICKQLETLVHVAEEKGFAIGIGHPHPETIDALGSCMGKYEIRVQYVTADLVLE